MSRLDDDEITHSKWNEGGCMEKKTKEKNLKESKEYVGALKKVNPSFQQKDIEHLTELSKSTISESKSTGLFTKYLAEASVQLRKNTEKLKGDPFEKDKVELNNALADMMEAICIADRYKKSNIKSLEDVAKLLKEEARLAEIGKNEGLFFCDANSYKSLPAKLPIIFDTTDAANLIIGVSNDDSINTVSAIKQWARKSRNLWNYLRLNVIEIPSAPPAEMIGSINDDGEVTAYAQDDGSYYPLSELGNDVFQNYCALIEDYDGKPCIPRNQKARVIEFLLTEIVDELTPDIERFLDSKLDEYEHQAEDGQIIDDPFQFLHSLTPDAPEGFAEMIEYLQLQNTWNN